MSFASSRRSKRDVSQTHRTDGESVFVDVFDNHCGEAVCATVIVWGLEKCDHSHDGCILGHFVQEAMSEDIKLAEIESLLEVVST